MPPTTGEFQFQVFHPPTGTSKNRKRNCHHQAGCAEPQEPPSLADHSLLRLRILFASKTRLQFHCSSTASSAAPCSPRQPVGSWLVASTWVLAEATAFAPCGCFTTQKGLSGTQGDSGEAV